MHYLATWFSRNMFVLVSRLEDKETEMKREYSKLHDRYTELFKTHIDYMERTKILMGTDRLENFGMPATKRMNNIMTRSAGPVSIGFSSLENNSILKSIASPNDGINSMVTSPAGIRTSSSVNIQEEMTMDDITDNQPDQAQNGSSVEGIYLLLLHSRNFSNCRIVIKICLI